MTYAAALACVFLLSPAAAWAEHGPPAEIIDGKAAPSCLAVAPSYLPVPGFNHSPAHKSGAVSITNNCDEAIAMTSVATVPALPAKPEPKMVAQLITMDGGYAHYSHFFYTPKGGDCVFPIEGGDSRTKCKNLPLPVKGTLALMIPWGDSYSISGATSSGKPVAVEGRIINPRDPSEAIDINLPKAQAGDVEAQYALGLLYIAEGSKHDIKAAEKWLEAAANQDFEDAQASLAHDYDYGLLGPADSAKSFFWWSVLAREKPLDGFTGYRDLAGTHLTAQQRADIGKQADVWKPSTKR
jgi:hypothetical protein